MNATTLHDAAEMHGSARYRVLLASTSYPSSLNDWKGLFIQRLVEALARRPEIGLQLWCPPGPVPSGVQDGWRGNDSTWLNSLLERGGIAHMLRKHPARGLPLSLSLMYRLRRAYQHSQAHIFHVNWLQNAITLPGDGRPALVTVLGTDMQLLRLPGMRTLLRRAFDGRQVAICPNAEWMLPDLESAFGDIAHVRFVPFGIDPRWYALERRFVANAPSRWLCVSRITRAKLGTLFEWCAPHFANRQRELHLFGPMQEQIELPEWIHYHGPASPEELCDNWFPSAQGLITLSQHAEGRPQVMLEAMAAGLPIIASRLPAHEDLLDHREDGWLCDRATDVGDALAVFDDASANLQAGTRARTWAAREIGSWDDCAARYANLYRRLLDGRAA
ncbi:glycosyltransferase involved in cell wall biosynthesis [Lysobacter niabensis]|uniref:Glycosyltransferase involved in cell wall biosynthesis n=1 Tax=Agrilutibacter niabensis TaxID=380628 RepID=A0ABU1VKD3_9GAMM|nr:glycosyltransferase family 4 protein [Lysobacter niabensis]MDR7097748.1 glycosyltransferase involved in cell wall biosynthesis [Lysobacter niabensis]